MKEKKEDGEHTSKAPPPKAIKNDVTLFPGSLHSPIREPDIHMRMASGDDRRENGNDLVMKW